MLRINKMSLLHIFLVQIATTNSRTSTLWKLNRENQKIISLPTIKSASPDLRDPGHNPYDDDIVFDIIATTVSAYGDRAWSKHPKNMLNTRCGDIHIENDDDVENLTKLMHPVEKTNFNGQHLNDRTIMKGGTRHSLPKLNTDASLEPLDCGKPVNFTFYDDLIGIANRFNHPNIPEPDAIYFFLDENYNTKRSVHHQQSARNFDIQLLEKRLRKAKREKPRSIALYNQIGNFWRIKGDVRLSIECFRRALAISPTNSEVLLNLARVLYNLQYLDDAIHLTRRSLEAHPPDHSPWRQYFTLGEIFKSYGHFQESVLHLRHALELYPTHDPIKKALEEIENVPKFTLHFYTGVIILFLVLCVLLIIISVSKQLNKSNRNHNSNTVSNGGRGDINYLNGQEVNEAKVQRHFNRAMAMRSLKGLTVSRSNKYRK